MRRVQRRLREFWVGTLKRRDSEEGGLVVFEAAQQAESTSENYVRLFEAAEHTVTEFRKDVVRDLVGPPEEFGEPAIEAAIASYCRMVGIDPEAEWQRLLAEEAALREKHNQRLRSVGVPYRGVRRVAQRHRTTPCYCGTPRLDNSIHMECDGCGAIICYACAGCFCVK